MNKISTQPKIARCYLDSANNKHDTKLQFLVAEQRILIRGVIQSDDICPKNGNPTPTQVADIITKNALQIRKITSQFGDAIRREMGKGAKAN